jgi:hypothetical protein
MLVQKAAVPVKKKEQGCAKKYESCGKLRAQKISKRRNLHVADFALE